MSVKDVAFTQLKHYKTRYNITVKKKLVESLGWDKGEWLKLEVKDGAILISRAN